MKSLFMKKTGFILPAALFIVMIALVAFPDRYVATTLEGIKIWAVCVLPSLLPFFFLTSLVTGMGCLDGIAKKLSPVTKFLYGTGGVSAYVQLMSFLSGYPVGIKLVADLSENGVIDKNEATKTCAFCSTSGPLFIVGSVGTAMFGDKRIGLSLLIAHLLGSVACGVIFRFLPKGRSMENGVKKRRCDNVLYESVYSSVISVAVVGGFISIFFTLAKMLTDAGAFTPIIYVLTPLVGESNAHGIALSLIECTFACKSFASDGSKLGAVLACGAISLGGASVWCQSAVYVKKAGASFKIFALSKLAHTLISAAICYPVYLIIVR